LQIVLVSLGLIIIGYLAGQRGFVQTQIWMMGIGVVMMILTLKGILRQYQYHRALNQWLEANEGSHILFYPTKKPIQDLIETAVVPVLGRPYLKVYYQGPQIVGAVKRSIVTELLNKQVWRINKPVLARIQDGKVLQEDILEDLLAYQNGEISQERFIERIVNKEERLNTSG
jgi:hypothetical protein